jgi:hypothetical protein
MSWKEDLRNKAFGLLQNPRVAAALQDPRVTQGIVRAFQLRSELEKNVSQTVRQVAKTLNLATTADVMELRRAVSRLERQLEQERRERAEDIAVPRAMS